MTQFDKIKCLINDFYDKRTFFNCTNCEELSVIDNTCDGNCVVHFINWLNSPVPDE